MKKLVCLALVAVLAITGAFALDLGDVQGTWVDSNWNAEWTFSGDGKIVLKSDGVTVFTFEDASVQNYRIRVGADGVTISFSCKETARSYKFTKPLTLSTDLSLHIEPDWDEDAYDATMKIKLR